MSGAAAAASAAYHVEAAVIGAGVIGLAVARALAISGREVLILERSSSIGSGTSSRNSEVIHAGLYYSPPTSYKAKLCVEGKHLLYDYCNTHSIPHQQCGKLIVATTPDQATRELPQIIQKAKRNGVDDLQMLQPSEVKALEPEAQCFGAVFSPSTGVIDSHTLMLNLLGDAEAHGATLALNCPVEGGGIVKKGDGGEGNIWLHAGGMDLTCDMVVNCAGLFADIVAGTIRNGKTLTAESEESQEERQVDDQANMPFPLKRQFYAKGNYYKLSGQKSPFTHLVYPVPEPGGLGVHATIDLGGSTRFGPDVEWISPNVSNPDDIDLTVDESRAEAFYDEVRRYWPYLSDGALVPDYAGVRPKLRHPDLLQNSVAHPLSTDFVIEGPREHGIKGLVNLLGMESPGLTSSLAVAEEVIRTLEEDSSK